MPRQLRMFQANTPCHIISRGNNRNVCFYAHEDYLFYLECLNDACIRYSALVHAYVLMTNHVHLLVTPSTKEAIPQIMQSIGRRYVQYINKTYQRTGTLWEGRYKAFLIDAEQYLLACYTYIELNPVRAAMVEHPADYLWSSYAVNAGIRPRRQLTMHEVYTRLGADHKTRCQAYQELCLTGLSSELIEKIQHASTFSTPLGDNKFKQQIEQALKGKFSRVKRGRLLKPVHKGQKFFNLLPCVY